MSNSISLDSSILVEHYKGSQTDLLETLVSEAHEPITVISTMFDDIGAPDLLDDVKVEKNLSDPITFHLYICQTVVSEYLFQCLIIDSGGTPSPLTLKRNGKIPDLIRNDDHADFLTQFNCLHGDSAIFSLAPQLMERYNLLPNDAIILGLCKFHEIKVIASFDRTDFIDFCQDEGIVLISSVADFEAYKSSLS